MMKSKVRVFVPVIFLLAFSVFSFLYHEISGKGVIWADPGIDVSIVPELDISLFSPYKIKADIVGEPSSVIVDITGINGDNPDPMCWDYRVDGTCQSTTVTKSLTYNSVSGLWESPNIYPDYIYPEIYYAGSDITWYNVPSEIPIWRRSYHVMKFDNPFTMVDGMSFWIEINAVPNPDNNLNSSNLEVYLVEMGVDNSYFDSDWRSKAQTELVGTISKDASFNHQHTANSSHHLIALSTNSDGTIGSKNLEVSNGFMVVLYNDSVNTSRGWNLRYHGMSLCNNTESWYVGDRSGGGTWNTPVFQAGCPDAHVHVARRVTDVNTTIKDGVSATVTAYYLEGDPIQSIQDFYYSALPDLPPNSTSFNSPIIGSIYDGDSISVDWNPATDPNNDPLVYSIYLLDENGQVISTIVTNSINTSYVWDITGISNGIYSLKGIVTEDVLENPLSTEFYLGGTFEINKGIELYSLSNISISSDNDDLSWAKLSDIVTLTFLSSGIIDPTVSIQSGGYEVTGIINISSESNLFTVTYVINENDTEGTISFEIIADNLDQIYYEIDDDSFVMVDLTSPSDPIADPASGTYSDPLDVSLSALGADYIRYVNDGAELSCYLGNLYESLIGINLPVTISAIACDFAGNFSNISIFDYIFEYSLYFDAQGGEVFPVSKQVLYGEEIGELPIPIRTGYTFTGWNTASNGIGDEYFSTTVYLISGDTNLYAQWVANAYTVTFDAQGGDVAPLSKQVTYSYVIGELPIPTLVGYDFFGWNTNSDGSGTTYIADTVFLQDQDITLYAIWSVSTYIITFDAQGGNVSPGTKDVAYGSAVGELPVPTNTGYDFINWNTQSDGNGDSYYASTYYLIENNLTLYAIWEQSIYSLNFDAQGGDVSPGSVLVVYGSEVGELPFPNRTGYSFDSWNNEIDGSGMTFVSNTLFLFEYDVALYAQWMANMYELYFNTEGGNVSVNIKEVLYGEEVGELPIPTKAGYSFNGWFTDIEGLGDFYDNVTYYLVDSSTNLYAYWVANTYTVAFNTQGGEVLPSLVQVTYLQEVGELPIPTKTGYTFGGWFTEANGMGDEYISTTIYDVTDNMVLIAYWIANEYTIYFDPQESTVSPFDKLVSYEQAIGVLPVPIRTGYTFVEWNTQSDGSGETYISTSVYLETNDMTLYAIYEINEYVLNSLVSGQGSIQIDPGSLGGVYEFGTTITMTAVAEAGWKFVGWGGDIFGKNEVLTFNIDSNLDILANFELIKYFIVNVPTGIEIEIVQEGYSLEEGFLPNTEFSILIKDSNGVLVAKKSYLITEDIDLSDVSLGVDVNNRKAFIHGLSGNYVLYVPKSTNDTRVGICPGASSLASVNENCIGLYYLDVNSSNVVIVEIEGRTYWEINGLTGTGGFSVSASNETLTQTGHGIVGVLRILTFIVIVIGVSISIKKRNWIHSTSTYPLLLWVKIISF